MLKKGSRGDEVKGLQSRLTKLGFDIQPDGVFGDGTKAAVEQLQTLFNYDVDGIVGPGTEKLIDKQIEYGWNLKAPDAKAKAQASNPVAAKKAAPPAKK